MYSHYASTLTHHQSSSLVPGPSRGMARDFFLFFVILYFVLYFFPLQFLKTKLILYFQLLLNSASLSFLNHTLKRNSFNNHKTLQVFSLYSLQ